MGIRGVEVSQNEGYPFRGPIRRNIIFLGLNWGSVVLGRYRVELLD